LIYFVFARRYWFYWSWFLIQTWTRPIAGCVLIDLGSRKGISPILFLNLLKPQLDLAINLKKKINQTQFKSGRRCVFAKQFFVQKSIKNAIHKKFTLIRFKLFFWCFCNFFSENFQRLNLVVSHCTFKIWQNLGAGLKGKPQGLRLHLY